MIYLDKNGVIQLISNTAVEGVVQLVHIDSGMEYDLVRSYGACTFLGAPYQPEYKHYTEESLMAHYLAMGQEYRITLNGEIVKIGESAKKWWDYKE